ncbi:MAG: hypothetical protein J0M34_04620 [Alphaproteobacteria bacterium]|nr:hypothetical protein [Alphaproteobacteria bacterium]
MQNSRVGFESITPSYPNIGIHTRLVRLWYRLRSHRIEHVHQTIQQILFSYVEQHNMEYQLELSRKRLQQFEQEQSCITHLTGREVGVHYKQILAYAEYLEERIIARRADPSVRDDYDGVCEQAYNLRLITHAIGLLNASSANAISQPVNLSTMMQSTLLNVSTMLDRRAMKLNSETWEEGIHIESQPALLQALVMLTLLGTLRLAEDDSMLSVSATETNRSVSIHLRVNLMRPGALTEAERYAFLEQCMYGRSTHVSMFASTLKQHANIQLASLLASRIGAAITIEPIDSHACDVVLELPRTQ